MGKEKPVYTDASGKGGSGSELAQKVLSDIKQYAGIEGKQLLFMLKMGNI